MKQPSEKLYLKSIADLSVVCKDALANVNKDKCISSFFSVVEVFRTFSSTTLITTYKSQKFLLKAPVSSHCRRYQLLSMLLPLCNFPFLFPINTFFVQLQVLIAFPRMLGVPLFPVISGCYACIQLFCQVLLRNFKSIYLVQVSFLGHQFSDPQLGIFHRTGNHTSFVSVLIFALFHLVTQFSVAFGL